MAILPSPSTGEGLGGGGYEDEPPHLNPLPLRGEEVVVIISCSVRYSFPAVPRNFANCFIRCEANWPASVSLKTLAGQ